MGGMVLRPARMLQQLVRQKLNHHFGDFALSSPALQKPLPQADHQWSLRPWTFTILALPGFAACEAIHSGPKDSFKTSMSGIWIRDDQATDLKAYERQLEVMQITGMKKKTAMKFIEGLQLIEKEDGAVVQFLTAVPFFKVTEEVTFGSTVTQPRRDKRKGEQTAKATRSSTGMTVEMRWEEPLAGHLVERYHIDADTLNVESKVVVRGSSASARLVYRRNDKWRPRLSL